MTPKIIPNKRFLKKEYCLSINKYNINILYMNQTCKIIALIHVIVSIGIIIWASSRAEEFADASAGYRVFLVILYLGPICVSWILHSIVCSYNLWYINIILFVPPILFLLYKQLSDKRFHDAHLSSQDTTK
jgi:hypothetical protein